MTTMIMVQKDGDVILGWDSQMTSGNEQTGATSPKFFPKAGIIVGVAGSFAALDQIEFMDLPEYDGSDPRAWIINEFSPRVRGTLSEIPGQQSKDGSFQKSGLFLVVDGQGFDLDSLLSPTRNAEGVYAMGTGGTYAKGALHYAQLIDELDNSHVYDALVVAGKMDIYTGGEYTVTSAANYLKGQIDD